MEALDQMLTDPLEPASGMDCNGIMEECMLGGTRVSLPEDLLEDPEIFFDVISMDTWTEVLTDSQREHLKKFLPHFPENNTDQQNQIISSLFSGENFRFGNPMQIAQKLFRDGYFNPEVVKYRKLCLKSQYKRYQYSQQQYFHNLLKQILVSRKELLDFARKSGPDLVLKRTYPTAVGRTQEKERRAQRRYLKILREVNEECGDSTVSSDEEDVNLWPPKPQALPTSPGVCLRIVPTLSTQDMKTVEKPELGESKLKLLLKRHREKRKRQPDHPDLVTGDLTLNDIMARVNTGRKGSLSGLINLEAPKKKVREKEEKKKKKLKVIKTEPEDLSESLGSVDGVPALSQEPQGLALPAVKEEPMDDVKPILINEIAASFFSLLQEIFLMEGPATLSVIEEKVLEWQSSPASTLNCWYSSAPNWSELVHSALQFLTAGMAALTPGFTPYVDYREKTQQWKWIGPGQDAEKDISALCQLWLETKDQSFGKEGEEPTDAIPPTPRVRTDYVVRPSTGEEKRTFQEQEQQRYNQPHKAFTFRMHGFESVVGPVKGVFDKETSLNKAREHSLLRSDRPAYVTILSLVRDAAARLPNGEGTRAEICELLKDSQFLAPEVTSAQINTVVSGALDRLHYEKDPCVKYDIGRKLWIYLHRDRSEEEFERIHQAQAAAAKAKKALQQKPKPATKMKSSAKESGTKVTITGLSEQSQLSAAEPSVPQTPGTPVTPTMPAVPVTPISPPPAAVSGKSMTSIAAEPTKPSQSVLLVSSASMPQLGTLLSTTQAGQPQASTQPAARVVTHPASTSLPHVRVVTAQAGLSAASPQTTVVTQQLQQQPTAQIRVPAPIPQTKVLSQTVVTVPVKTQASASPVHVQRPVAALTGQAGITVTGLTTVAAAMATTKLSAGTPGSPIPTSSPSTPTVVQNVGGPNIIKQVAIAGQLGMKTQPSTSIPLTTTNLRIQGKDVLRLPPSSITTDAKGQTVLRITPDMMATLAKSQVTTVKLTPDILSAAAASSGGKGISATFHVTPSAVQPVDSPVRTTSSSTPGATVVKVMPDLKTAESPNSAIRLMPTLAVTVADQKGKTITTPVSTDSKPATTIRIMPGLGVIPQKHGQTITVTTTKQVASSGATVVHTAAVTLPTVSAAGSKTVAVASGTAGSPLSIGTGTATVRQVPVNVSTSQAGKLPARITVPLSMISQPMKGKSVVTTPIIKGNLGANLSGLGRNIILTTMPAGTKLIAGNKPVSFVTAQQFQQLQQQGQATQVRIQTLPASQLQQGSAAASSPKPVSTVVVTAAPSPKQAQDQQ
ncbi:nuclear factor related to kappa-B-binding protein isoform X3 [Latimeria chalumnae]|uniref:nuclear factor related to kappa-B-binding protein isoform X3 n=1 Tax=Latimeria chalumnae TaxID=7897 RepID=UPI00313E6611